MSILFASLLTLPLSASGEPEVEWTPAERRRLAAMSPVPAVPPDPTNRYADDPAAALFGQRVFFDARFSQRQVVSCIDCHDPHAWFTDGLQRSIGLGRTDRRSPSLVGVAHHRWFFWDGRADTLWAQALHPFEEPREHGFDRVSVARAIASDETLAEEYKAIFGPLPDLHVTERFPPAARPARGAGEREQVLERAWQGMTEADRDAINRVFVNVGKALAAYQRKLQSGEAPFDRFVRALLADDGSHALAMSIEAQRGLKLFMGEAGCRVCHFGPVLSDGEFHTTGVPPLNGGRLHDAGRFAGIRTLRADPFRASGRYSDDPEAPIARMTEALVDDPQTWGRFRTPSLRNVAERAPYMHEGQFWTLREVIEHYSTLERAVLPAHHQERVLRPLHLTERQMDDLEAFLRELTGDPPPERLRRRPR